MEKEGWAVRERHVKRRNKGEGEKIKESGGESRERRWKGQRQGEEGREEQKKERESGRNRMTERYYIQINLY